jgi:predicted nucleic acid-binding protein
MEVWEGVQCSQVQDLTFELESRDARRILRVDTAVARRSAGLHVPNPRPVRDALIAATALVHGLTVVTRNVVDFESTGVQLLNPWLSNDPRM